MGGRVIVLINQEVKLKDTQKLGVVKKCFPKHGEVLVAWSVGEPTIELVGNLEIQNN